MSDALQPTLRDLMRSVRMLDPANDATLMTMARMLGYDTAEPEEAEAPEGGDAAPPDPFDFEEGPEGGSEQEDGEPEPPPVPTEQAIRFTLTQTHSLSAERPDWVVNVDGQDALPLPDAQPASDPPSIHPLFRTFWERSILSATLTTLDAVGPVDLKAAVVTLAKGHVLHTLPRLPAPTLAHGVQLLMDRSDGMMPFLEDLKQIKQAIDRLVGEAALEMLRFAGCPTRGAGPRSERTWTNYEADWMPARGMRVVCVTDLGISRPPGPEAPANASEWLDFDEMLRRHDCPLVIVTPYGPDRWPAALGQRLDIVHWHDTMSAAVVQRIVRF